MAADDVLFRVTRPNTSVFHPDRAVSVLPVQTGGEIRLPRETADYHVKNGVGVIVTDEPEASEEPETPETPETPEEPKADETEAPKAPARRPGRPSKSAE